MTSQYRIIIKNMSTEEMSFYAFQEQASFTVSGAAPAILSSSLASGPLAPYDSSGAQLDFAFDAQNYAGAKSNILSPAPETASASISPYSTTSSTSEASAEQAIDLTTSTPGQSVPNCSTLTVSPLGLSGPVYQSTVPADYFGIQVPAYEPGSVSELYCGCAAINQDGSVTLSSYITPLPSSQIYCAPVPYYYVKTGSVPVGQVISYDTSSSASCDFTSGYSTINVQYNSNGSFSITSSL